MCFSGSGGVPTPAVTVSKEKGDGYAGDRGNGAEDRAEDNALAMLLQAAGLRLKPARLGFQDQLAVQPAAEAGIGLDGHEEAMQMARQFQQCPYPVLPRESRRRARLQAQ